MREWFKLMGCLAALLLAIPVSIGAAAANEEQQLIHILGSNTSLAAKDAACEKLKLVGTRQCIPAVAKLLSDPQLSHSARYVLEAMPLRDASQALINALNVTEGSIQAGIIGSLGSRGEITAVPALMRLLRSSNPEVVIASARALGQIGRTEAVRPLQELARSSAVGIVHEAAVDGLLRCAQKLQAAGSRSRALAIYQRLYRSERTDTVQVAAFRGIVSIEGAGAVGMVTRGIQDNTSPVQIAALQCARDLPGRETTAVLAGLLPRLDQPRQIALLEALSQRGDPAAAPAIAALADRSAGSVRLTVIKILGGLGDASLVPMLSEFAAWGTDAEKAAARQSLDELRRGRVEEMLVTQLANARPEVQAELARALGLRGETSAIPRLFELAEKGKPSARKSAIKALGLLVDEPQLPMLIRYVATTKDSEARAEASQAVNYACQHIVSKRGRIDPDPLVKGILLGTKEARIALLPACSSLVNPDVRVAIRSGVTDRDPQVQAVGVATLCDTMDPDLLDDLVSLARHTKDEKFRNDAITAGVRLATQEESIKISKGQRVAVLKALLDAAARPEEKRLVLAGLGEVPDADALRTVEPLLQDQALHNEAARAAVKIAVALPGTYAKSSMAILQKGLDAPNDEATRKALEGALKQLQDSMDFITDWMAAGPFRQEGKDYAALFDFVFPPEMDNPKGVDWKFLPAGTDSNRPFVMDLLKAMGGQQCVAYARTWIQCDKERPMRLELGSDDGVKVWLNDKQVYALNTARALTPGSDKVNVTLHPGWNMLLLKVTQNNLGWEFCAKLVNPDGSHYDGLKIEAAPKATSASSP
jgi:HEAT repeat protein